MSCRWLILMIFLGGLLTSCKSDSSQPILIKDAWVRAASIPAMKAGVQSQGGMDHGSGGNTAAYLLIRNNGDSADRLIRVKTSAAHAAELHKSDEVDGVMTMRPVESIEVPAGGETELQPGGFHIMLLGLMKDLPAGDRVQISLEFEKAGEVTVEAVVRAP